MMESASDSPTGAVDWAALRERIAVAAAALERGSELSAEGASELLRARAAALAATSTAGTEEPQREMAVFTLGSERVALPAELVIAVQRFTQGTPLPGVQIPVAGITAWRGELLVLLDVRNPRPAFAPGSGYVLVLGRGSAALGLLADGVTGVETFRVAELDAAVPNPSQANPFMRAVTHTSTVLLDGDKLIQFVPEVVS